MLREGVAQWDGGALPSPECRETYKGRPEDAQRTLRGRSEALRGRSEGAQRRAETRLASSSQPHYLSALSYDGSQSAHDLNALNCSRSPAQERAKSLLLRNLRGAIIRSN